MQHPEAVQSRHQCRTHALRKFMEELLRNLQQQQQRCQQQGQVLSASAHNSCSTSHFFQPHTHSAFWYSAIALAYCRCSYSSLLKYLTVS